MTNAQHTQGPLVCEEWECNPRLDGNGNRYWGIKPAKFHCGAQYLEASGWMLDGNARLLAAAYTSYDKHCGPNAIAAAEADLLGEALEALEYLVAQLADGEEPDVDDDGDEIDPIENARAILAKAGRDA